ncbi:MAG: anti-sigma factor [Devosia sp.]
MSSEGEQGGSGDEDRVLVAEFALGLLDAAEHERVGRRILVEPALGRELTLWRLRLSSLDREFAETPAPAGVLDRVETRLFPPSAATAPAGFWNSLRFWRGLAAAGLAIAVIAVGIDLAPRPPLTGPELVAALETEGSNVKLIAFYDQTAGTIRIAALSGDAVPNKDFELWAIEGKNAPISMGVIPLNAKSNVNIPQTVKQGFGAGTVLAVTLEQKGGSPTGAPQGPIVAAGAATAI